MRLSAPIFRLKRQAKRRAREQGIALNDALDRVARQEGFPSWSLLAARAAETGPSSELLAALRPGDLVLLAARPLQGKTMLGLELIAKAVEAGRRGVFFTLEFNEREALERFRLVGGNPRTLNEFFFIDTSDAICADYVMERLHPAPHGMIAVIDYLQIMDQKRATPALSEQVSSLRDFARKSGTIIVFISQIDRSYALSAKPFPDLADIRLPNPLDLALFSKACFLNGGKMRIDRLT